jgi:hypothetical protein
MTEFRCLPWHSEWARFLGLLGLTSALCAQDCMRWVRRVDVGNPGPQSRHCLAYDRDAGLTLLFSSDTLSSLWQYDGTNWTAVTVAGPRPADRLDAAFAYDPIRKVTVLAGGFGRVANAALADTWTFTRTGPTEGRWTRQADLVGGAFRFAGNVVESAARDDARMVFDATLGQLVLFGGDAQATETFSNPGTVLSGVVSSPSRLVWSGIEWRREGHQPPGEPGTEMLRLSEFAFAFDSKRGQVLLHGGRRTSHLTEGKMFATPSDGLFIVRPNGLQHRASRAARLQHRMVYDPRRDRYVVFGGSFLKPAPNPDSVTELEASLPYLEFDPQKEGLPHVVPAAPGTIPSARIYHDMVYDERRGVTVLVGGTSTPGSLGNDATMLETWELRPALALTQTLPDLIQVCTDDTGALAQPTALRVEATSAGSLTYQWRRTLGTNQDVFLPSPESSLSLFSSLAGVWDVIVRDTCGNSVTSNPCLVKILTRVNLREQPVARHVCPGDPVETQVVAGPDSFNALLVDGLSASPERPVRYQWFRLGANGGPVPNATNAVLRIDAFQPEDNGFYQCRVSNDCGDRVSLSVPLTAGAWVVRDPSPTTNEVCTTTQLDVSALGKGTVRFQWRRNGDPLSPEDPRVTGAQLSTLTFTALRYLDDATYDCVVSDSCNSVTSRVATVGVFPNPPFLRVDTNGPSARQNHAMAYDSRRGVSVLFGGIGSGATAADVYRNDTWEYDGARWTPRPMAVSPSPRVNFGLSFDSHRQRIVLFGGLAQNADARTALSGETWEYDGTAWTQRFPTRSPAPRSNHALFYDPVHRVTTLYGGDTELPNPRAGDIWTWDGTNWTERVISGARPQFGPFGSPARPRMVWDVRRGHAVLPPTSLNQGGPQDYATWTWDGEAWTRRPYAFTGFGSAPWVAGSGIGLVYDTFRGEVIYWGGDQGDQARLWRWNGDTWRLDPIPEQVGHHLNAAAAYDQRRHSVVWFGGNYNGSDGQPNGVSQRTFERVLADVPRVLRQPVVLDDPTTHQLAVRVIAAGTGTLTYEWQRDGVRLVEAFPYFGTTNDVLRIDRGLRADVGRYRCIIRGKCGETASLGTTLAGVLEGASPPLALTSTAVAGQPELSLTWEAPGALLEQASALLGPWTPIPAATSPYQPPTTSDRAFFRLRMP